MRWTIRNQIFVPFALLLAIAVATSAVTSSVLSARRAAAMELEQLARVLRSLDQAAFPYTANVLQRMKGLSGAEFVAVDAQGRPTASTLSDPVPPQLNDAPTFDGATTSLSRFPSVTVGERSYLAAGVPVRSVATSQRVYVLYPQEAWVQLQRSAAWPPLAIGGGTLLLMLLVSGWLAHRFGRRIDSVRRLFAELQAGRYPRLEPPSTHDELRTLVESANELSARLEALQNEIRRTERLRVLAQLAGGFAHQLRNAVTGARMAVQLHQRVCDDPPGDDSLAVALAQLKLTEQQVQGLLSLSREPTGPRTGGDLQDILREVETLLTPHC